MIICPVCNSTKTKQYFSNDILTLFKCKGCGLKFQHPMPTPEVLDKIYSSNYHDTFYPERILGEQKLLFLHRMEMLERLGGKRNGKVLDIGSGKGMFLEAAMERGWHCVGQEFSDDAAEAVKNRLGVEMIICSEIAEAGFPPESFDIVNLNHVLEHLYEPVKIVNEIYRILKPGGLFYCEVPRQSNSLNILSNLFGKKDFGFSFLPEHLFLFDKKSMDLLLKKANFDLIMMTIQGVGDSHRYVRGVHYTSMWTHLIVRVVSIFKLQTLLGGGNMVAISKKTTGL